MLPGVRADSRGVRPTVFLATREYFRKLALRAAAEDAMGYGNRVARLAAVRMGR